MSNELLKKALLKKAEDYINTKILKYDDFLKAIEDVGFMPLSNNCINFINLSDLTELAQWHTGLESDPWQWRVKIETDNKAAYAKLFDKRPGFISLEWYPIFLAARRKSQSFKEIYTQGLISNYAKNIYDLFERHDNLAIYEIKALAGFTKETNSKYESAMCELQMGMFITINGTKQKISAKGDLYGWPATAYTTVEKWAGHEMIEKVHSINPEDAMDEIMERAAQFAQNLDVKKIRKFVGF